MIIIFTINSELKFSFCQFNKINDAKNNRKNEN